MSDYDDAWLDPSAKRWIRRVVDDMVPKLEGSALTMSLVPSGTHSEGDVKFWVELGASIMMNKPILLVAFHDDVLPPKLEQVADRIVRCPEGVNPGSSKQVADAIEEMVREINGDA